MSKVTNILLVGVGGQGTILASKILSTGLVEKGYDVKMAEIHGMSQRGGSVSTQVRFGEQVYAPVVEEGDVDILVSFETMETYRWLDFLKKDGKVVMNRHEIPSAPVLSGKMSYPENLEEEIKGKISDIVIFDAMEEAEALGNFKTMNVVLLGALVKAMDLEDFDWEDVIKRTVKEKFVDINILAFNRGKEIYEGLSGR